MNAYLLWGWIAAMVPATLVVIGIVYGLRALKHARATRVELALLEHGVVTARHIGLMH